MIVIALFDLLFVKKINLDLSLVMAGLELLALNIFPNAYTGVYTFDSMSHMSVSVLVEGVYECIEGRNCRDLFKGQRS
jgi:hypothetical protein